MQVYTAHVVTESSDHYIWVYAKEPSRDQIIQRLYEYEHAADIDWYEATTSVQINTTEMVE